MAHQNITTFFVFAIMVLSQVSAQGIPPTPSAATPSTSPAATPGVVIPPVSAPVVPPPSASVTPVAAPPAETPVSTPPVAETPAETPINAPPPSKQVPVAAPVAKAPVAQAPGPSKAALVGHRGFEYHTAVAKYMSDPSASGSIPAQRFCVRSGSTKARGPRRRGRPQVNDGGEHDERAGEAQRQGENERGATEAVTERATTGVRETTTTNVQEK
ncbi:hypothetical protein R1sor_007676 [Riccia sorocarpa]|uniref:Uncharacterized protein n=1 Tax=Riccia sorocarpa TaxID=122646 RepID=A0ABD3HVB2_9MARC